MHKLIFSLIISIGFISSPLFAKGNIMKRIQACERSKFMQPGCIFDLLRELAGEQQGGEFCECSVSDRGVDGFSCFGKHTFELKRGKQRVKFSSCKYSSKEDAFNACMTLRQTSSSCK